MIRYLVWDYGGFVEHALALADGGKNHVWYYTPWAKSNASKFESYAPGLGFEKEGMEKILYFADYIDQADCIVFFDKGAGDIAKYLRKVSGKPVYGAGKGEKIENDRELLGKMQSKVGLLVPERKLIKGVPALREYLKDKKDKYIKINIFRGDFETALYKSFDGFKPILDRIELDLGPFNEFYDFFVETPIPGKEPGFDAFYSNGKYATPFIWGFAMENWINFGKFVDVMPKPLQDVADKLKPILKSVDYRGAIGTEVRITEGDKEHYLTDLTCRFSTPVAIAYPVVINNFPELIYKLAKGEDVKIKTKAKYFVMLPLSSSYSKENWVKMEFDQKYRNFVKSPSIIKIKDSLYAVKGSDYIYTLVGYGNSLEECITILKNLSKKVDAWGLDKTTVDGLDKIPEFVKDCPKYNLGAF